MKVKRSCHHSSTQNSIMAPASFKVKAKEFNGLWNWHDLLSPFSTSWPCPSPTHLRASTPAISSSLSGHLHHKPCPSGVPLPSCCWLCHLLRTSGHWGLPVDPTEKLHPSNPGILSLSFFTFIFHHSTLYFLPSILHIFIVSWFVPHWKHCKLRKKKKKKWKTFLNYIHCCTLHAKNSLATSCTHSVNNLLNRKRFF